MDKVKHPFGLADIKTPDYAATIEVAIDNNFTVIQMPALTGNAAVDLDINVELRAGAILIIAADQGATGRNVTLGTGFVGTGITGVANDKDTISFYYDGVVFRQFASVKNVDAA